MVGDKKTIGVVFGTIGGMGDCGKFIVGRHGYNMENVEIRPVLMWKGKKENIGVEGMDIDVHGEGHRKEEVLERIKNMENLTKMDVDDKDTQEKLENVFDGCDAVIIAMASRQPMFPRWLASGTDKIVSAMEKKNVSRLVCLSSMGIGNDFIPRRGIRLLWGCLLHTFIKGAYYDLKAMEKIIKQSKLDYVLVRVVGITPEYQPTDTYKFLTKNSGKQVDFGISKADVAKALLDQAINPTFHKTAVTLFQKFKSSNE